MWESLTNRFLNSQFNRIDDDDLHPGDLWPMSSGSSGSTFQKYYECLSSTYAFRDDVENGNKILLPSSALNVLARQEVAWPMLFELSNTEFNLSTHCGVLEFSAEEGKCVLPLWLMHNLNLENGQLVRVTSVALPKGTFVKLQATTSDFLDLSNHRAVLENSLRHYACVTVGDRINIKHNDKVFEVEILETKPSPAISVIETDLEVDFAPPKDYVEPPPRQQKSETLMGDDGAGAHNGSSEGDGDDDGTPPHSSSKGRPPKLNKSNGQRLDGQSPGATADDRSRSDKDDKKKALKKLEPWLDSIPGGVHTYNETYARRSGTSARAHHILRGLGSRLDDHY